MIIFDVFSDGSSFNNGYKNKENPQLAACAILISYKEKILYQAAKSFQGDEATISHAELMGAYLAITKTYEYTKKLKKFIYPINMNFYSDSQFVIKGVNEWMTNWIVRDWKNYEGKPIGQVDLWKKFYNEILLNKEIYNIKFIHIKGHQKDNNFIINMNNKCDNMAKDKLLELRKSLNV